MTQLTRPTGHGAPMFITVPSGPQWLIIVLLVLLIFGAHRLPAVAAALGTSIRRFRDSYRGDPPDHDDPTSDL